MHCKPSRRAAALLSPPLHIHAAGSGVFDIEIKVKKSIDFKLNSSTKFSSKWIKNSDE